MLWSERGPMVVDIEESPRPIFMNIRSGSLLPLTGSAAGHAFGAFLPDDTQIKTDTGEHTIRSEFGASWNSVIAPVRTAGLASVQGLLVPGIVAMAAPVFDHRGRKAVALAFLAREEDVAGERRAETERILLETAHRFSLRLGYQPSA